MDLQESVDSAEELGRSVSSSKNAVRARRSRLPYHEFLPRRGVAEISVDRLSVATPVQSTAIADRRDAARGRTFYGWAVVTSETACMNGRSVVVSPMPDINPYHADIVLPASAAEDRNEQIRHAQQLRDASSWRERSLTQESV